MKKITLTLIAVSVLGLAACTKTTPTNNVVANDTNAMNAAMSDLTNTAMDASNTATNAAATATNAADAAADAAMNAGAAATNAAK